MTDMETLQARAKNWMSQADAEDVIADLLTALRESQQARVTWAAACDRMEDAKEAAEAECDQLRTQLAALTEAQRGWQPIETAPKNEELIFWVVPKTAEEAYIDTSGNSIFSCHDPRWMRGRFGTWSSLEKATHWMSLPKAPR